MLTVWGAARGKTRKRQPRQPKLALGRLLFTHGLGPRVHTLEADLVEGGVVTKKPTTPEDTREQGDTNTQYNRQTTALHSHQHLASGCRRGMQLQCNVVWNCSALPLANTKQHTHNPTPHYTRRVHSRQRRGLFYKGPPTRKSPRNAEVGFVFSLFQGHVKVGGSFEKTVGVSEKLSLAVTRTSKSAVWQCLSRTLDRAHIHQRSLLSTYVFFFFLR